MTAVDHPDDFSGILLKSSLVLAGLTIAGFLIFDARFGYGVLSGGGIALANYLWMKSIMQRILTLTIARPVMFAQTRFILRYGLTGLALYFLLRSAYISIPGLLVGLSVIVLTLTTLSLVRVVRSGG